MNIFRQLTQVEIKKIIQNSKSTTCELDIIPTTKLKEHLEHFLPVITEIVNRSLTTGTFPGEWKNAVISPLLKKKGLPLELKNYRPISNLSFLSKVLEKAALQQVVNYVEESNFLPSYQSAYRQNHGVETSMIKMYSDLLQAVDQGKVCLVVMLDLSAAFDTVDIPILLKILRRDFSITGVPLNWLKSYLSGRSQRVVVNSSTSKCVDLQYGVPQGSCVGPVVFTLYIAALNKVVQKYSPELYGYADDHKIALAFYSGDSDNEAATKIELEKCLEDVVTWMSDHKLKMNNTKTEIIIYGTKQQLSKKGLHQLNVGGVIVNCVDTVRDLGVWMDSSLSFDLHITKKCQIASHQLHNLRAIRKNLSKKSAEVLVHGLIHSHLDFCNGLFAELPNIQINRLQKIQNRAARIVTRTAYDASVQPVLKSLHWLPVRARIMYKVIVLVFKSLKQTAPKYLSDMLNIQQSRYSLRSGDTLTLIVPRTRTKMAERSFTVVGPKWWNQLPNELKDTTCEEIFRRKLKTHLFRQFY
jgi:hypothetical protein